MLLPLIRLRMSVLVTLSALTGLAVAPGHPSSSTTLELALGVLLLAAAASTLNQVQEWRSDACMERTRRRPIPSGHLSPGRGLAIGLLLLIAGFYILNRLALPAVTAVAAAILLLYHGLYTPLKRRTPFALLAGSLAGALPPLIGWLAAGGNASDLRILVLCALLFLWQIPHFWDLAWRDPQELERAGLASWPRHLPAQHLGPIGQLYLLALATIVLVFPLVGLLRSSATALLLILCASCLALGSLRNLYRAVEGTISPPTAPLLHFLLGMVLTSLLVDGMLSPF